MNTNTLRNLAIAGLIYISPLQEATAQNLFGSLKVSTSEMWMLAGGAWTENPALTGTIGLTRGNQEYSLTRMFDMKNRDSSSGNHTVLGWTVSLPTSTKKLAFKAGVSARFFDTERNKNQIVLQWSMNYALNKKTSSSLTWAYVAIPEGNNLTVIRWQIWTELWKILTLHFTVWEKTSRSTRTTAANVQLVKNFKLSPTTDLQISAYGHMVDICTPPEAHVGVSATIKFKTH